MASTSIVRTTPQASLELMTYTHPLDLFVKEIRMTTYMRLKSQLDNPWKSIGLKQVIHIYPTGRRYAKN